MKSKKIASALLAASVVTTAVPAAAVQAAVTPAETAAKTALEKAKTSLTQADWTAAVNAANKIADKGVKEWYMQELFVVNRRIAAKSLADTVTKLASEGKVLNAAAQAAWEASWKAEITTINNYKGSLSAGNKNAILRVFLDEPRRINQVNILEAKAKAGQATQAELDKEKVAVNNMVNTTLKNSLLARLNAIVIEVKYQVESVTAVNGKELVVKFTQPVDATDAKLPAKYLLNNSEIASATNIAVSEDGKTVTLATTDVINVTNGVLVIDSIKTKADAEKKTVKHATLFTYKDTVAPVVEKVEAKGGVATITFAEALNGTPGVSVNNATYTNVEVSGKTLKIKGLEEGKSYSAELVGAKDAAGNLANPISLNFTVGKADAAQAQAVTVSINENKVTLKFVNALSSDAGKSATVKFKAANTTFTLAGTAATGVSYKDDNKTVVIDTQAASVLGTLNFLNTDIEVSGAGLANAVTVNTTLASDKTAAKLVGSTTTAAGKLVLEFSEEVQVPAGGLTSLTITTIDGIYQSAPVTYSVAAAYAKNDKNEDVKTKLQLTLPSVVAVGTPYVVEVAANAVKDTYGNNTDKFSVSVVKPATDTAKPTEKINVGVVVTKNVLKLTFSSTSEDKGVTAAAVDASNYTLGGRSLPSGTVLRYVDNKSNVEIVLPTDSIKTTGDYVLTMSNIKDTANNTLVAGQGTKVINLVEMVAPVATSLTVKSSTQAVVTFSEKVQSVDITADGYTTALDGIIVKVNGQTKSPVLTLVDDTNELVITGLDLKLTDSLSVEFKNAEIQDMSANKTQIKDATIAK
jgi:hypothetical protein